MVGGVIRHRLVRAMTVVALGLSGLAAWSGPAAAAPLNTVPPSISGMAEYAAELTASPGTWTPEPTSYAYRWLRDGEPIAKATGPTLSLIHI